MDFFFKSTPVYFEDCNHFNRTEVKNEKCLYYLIKYAHFHLSLHKTLTAGRSSHLKPSLSLTQ